jgi:hypothetical protein
VTSDKAWIPLCHFGQVGLACHIRKDGSEQRADYGIFLGYGDHRRYMKIYIPDRFIIYSMKKFVPNPTDDSPASW